MLGSPPADLTAGTIVASERPTVVSGARLRFERKSVIPKASGHELAAWVLRRRKRMRVSGASMEPTLREGDVVFVDISAYSDARPPDGDVVVAIHPRNPQLKIIKRVEFSDDRGIYLRSDNSDEPSAADSRSFGMVPDKLIIGRVTATATVL